MTRPAGSLPSLHQDLGRKHQQFPTLSPSSTILDSLQGRILGFPLTSRKDVGASWTPAWMASCVCCGGPSPMTLRCPKPFGNGAEGTQSRRGTRGPRRSCLQRPRVWYGEGLARAQTCWYWGGLTVNEAKEKLEETREGAFLIRDSSNPDYLLTISVKTSAGPTNL